MHMSRSYAIRLGIGVSLGIAISYEILQYGAVYALSHVPAGILLQYNMYYYVSRIPWIVLSGFALGLLGTLVALRMPYYENFNQLALSVGPWAMLGTVLIISFQEYLFMGGPVLPNLLIVSLMNGAIFLVIGMPSFFLAVGVFSFLLNFTQTSRSARDIMPTALQHENSGAGKRRFFR